MALSSKANHMFRTTVRATKVAPSKQNAEVIIKPIINLHEKVELAYDEARTRTLVAQYNRTCDGFFQNTRPRVPSFISCK